MIKYDIDGKEIVKQTATPILIFCTGERNTTIGKIVCDNGKEYIIRVNENGKAQMT